MTRGVIGSGTRRYSRYVTLLMKLTVGALWLTAGATRRDLSSAEYLSRVDSHRTFAPVPKDAGAFGRLTEAVVGGSTVLRWQPRDHVAGRELIYLPGGGFVNPLVSQHWWIIQRIMTATQAAITIAPYPLTPEHTVDDAQAFIDAVYDDVAGRPSTTSLFVAGDSAGGNVAATLALRVRDGDRRPLDGLILLSPWVDPTMRTPGAWQRERRDPTLRCAGLRAAAEAWSGTRDLHDPQISPIDDSLAGLAPLLVFQGARDVFHDDAVAFVEKARAASTSARIVIAEDGFHVYPGAYWTREAREAYELIGRFVADPSGVVG